MSNNQAREIAKAGLSIKAIKLSPDDPFQWASGYRMPIYNDNRMFLFFPEYRKLIIDGFSELIEEEGIPCDIVAGTSTAGIPHGTALANKLDKPFIYIREKPKSQVIGRDFAFDEKQRIYFANHASHLDFLVIWSCLPKRIRERTKPVAAKDYWLQGRVRRFLSEHVFRAVFVDRNQSSRTENPIDVMSAALDQGFSLIIFPEGTRSPSGELQDFKSGIFHLAKKYESVELVPLFLENLNRILPKGEVIPVPLLSKVRFGRPLLIQEGEDRMIFLHRAKKALEELGL